MSEHLCHSNCYVRVATSALALLVYSCLASLLLQDYYPDRLNPLTLAAHSALSFLLLLFSYSRRGGGDVERVDRKGVRTEWRVILSH